MYIIIPVMWYPTTILPRCLARVLDANSFSSPSRCVAIGRGSCIYRNLSNTTYAILTNARFSGKGRQSLHI